MSDVFNDSRSLPLLPPSEELRFAMQMWDQSEWESRWCAALERILLLSTLPFQGILPTAFAGLQTFCEPFCYEWMTQSLKVVFLVSEKFLEY